MRKSNRLSLRHLLSRSLPGGCETPAVETLLNALPQPAIIVDSGSQHISCANMQASELSSYARASLLSLSLEQLVSLGDETTLDTLFKENSTADLPPGIEGTLIQQNGNRIEILLQTTRLTDAADFYLCTLTPEDRYRREVLAIRRQETIWADLNQLLAAYTLTDLSAALQQTLIAAVALSSAEASAIYQAEGDSPRMHQAAALDPEAYLPEVIPAQDLGQLNRAMLWSSGKRPITSLHQYSRSKKMSYTASAPIGQANTAIGVFVTAGNTPPPENILEINHFLSNVIFFIIQSHTLVTQLKEDLAQVKTSQLASETVFDAIEDGLIFLTPELSITRLNAAAEQSLGYTSSEVSGQSIKDVLICNENLDTTFRFAREGLNPTTIASTRLYHRNGESFLAKLQVHPIANPNGLQSILVIIHDLSEQEEYKARNQQLEQRATLADITASFAHEVRNPINNISTGLQLLAVNLPADDPNQVNISRLQNDCERLADLVKSGLSFVRPAEYKLEPVDLARLITNLMDRWRNRLAHTKVRYNPQIDTSVPPVEGDLRALEQVFTNLVDNAIQAMEQNGGTLTINLRHEVEGKYRSHVEVSILDTGPGIPPEAKEHIFEPFFSTKRSGTGLGLAIVKRIVTAHKGSILVSSIPGGTMFQVHLPTR